MDVRLKGDWEAWIKFFLKGVAFVSDEAVGSAKEIISLRAAGSKVLSDKFPNSNNHRRLHDLLFSLPIITRKEIKDFLEVSYPTANSMVIDFIKSGILFDIQPERKRNKQYIFTAYMNILERGTELDAR